MKYALNRVFPLSGWFAGISTLQYSGLTAAPFLRGEGSTVKEKETPVLGILPDAGSESEICNLDLVLTERSGMTVSLISPKWAPFANRTKAVFCVMKMVSPAK